MSKIKMVRRESEATQPRIRHIPIDPIPGWISVTLSMLFDCVVGFLDVAIYVIGAWLGRVTDSGGCIVAMIKTAVVTGYL